MRNRRDSSGGSREQGFELSYRLATEQLSRISDIEAQCHRSGASYISASKIAIDYLGQPYNITIPDAEISLGNSKTEVPLKDRILILHYFTSAKGTPPTGILINFKQLPGGLSYFTAFSQRTINPLVRHFGREPELLIDISAKLGGYKTEQGDVSAAINAFNHVPITFALWRGDEEFSPSGAVLFDANISDYLPTEDVTVLCETVVWRLVRSIPSA
jgi:hypothetical protein